MYGRCFFIAFDLWRARSRYEILLPVNLGAIQCDSISSPVFCFRTS